MESVIWWVCKVMSKRENLIFVLYKFKEIVVNQNYFFILMCLWNDKEYVYTKIKQ